MLVDDGSTDGTLSIMRSFNDHRVNIIESLGIADAAEDAKHKGRLLHEGN